jgi:hypothetical protein
LDIYHREDLSGLWTHKAVAANIFFTHGYGSQKTNPNGAEQRFHPDMATVKSVLWMITVDAWVEILKVPMDPWVGNQIN